MRGLACQKTPKEGWGLAASGLMGSAEMPRGLCVAAVCVSAVSMTAVCTTVVPITPVMTSVMICVHDLDAHGPCVHDCCPMTPVPLTAVPMVNVHDCSVRNAELMTPVSTAAVRMTLYKRVRPSPFPCTRSHSLSSSFPLLIPLGQHPHNLSLASCSHPCASPGLPGPGLGLMATRSETGPSLLTLGPRDYPDQRFSKSVP